MKTVFILPVLVAGTISLQARASEEISQAQVRELVAAGEILPLETILERFPSKTYGKLLDLEVERDDGVIVYEFEFLRGDGHIVEIKVDARDASLLEQEVED